MDVFLSVYQFDLFLVVGLSPVIFDCLLQNVRCIQLYQYAGHLYSAYWPLNCLCFHQSKFMQGRNDSFVVNRKLENTRNIFPLVLSRWHQNKILYWAPPRAGTYSLPVIPIGFCTISLDLHKDEFKCSPKVFSPCSLDSHMLFFLPWPFAIFCWIHEIKSKIVRRLND